MIIFILFPVAGVSSGDEHDVDGSEVLRPAVQRYNAAGHPHSGWH